MKREKIRERGEQNSTMKTRNIEPIGGGDAFAVSQHIILRNFDEYYLEDADENGMAFGYVMGVENEWGYVPLEEIEPYIIIKNVGEALEHVLPPANYTWKDED